MTAPPGPRRTPAVASAVDDVQDSRRRELNRLARGGALSIVGMSMNAALGFLALLVISHNLNLRDSGATFEAMALFTILSNIAELGADTGLLRFVPHVRPSGQEALRCLAVAALLPALGTACLLTAIAYLAIPQEAHLLAGHTARTIPSLEAELRIVLAFVPAASLMTVALAAVRAWSIRTSIAVMYIGLPILRVGLLLPLLAFHPTARMAALGWVLPYGLAAVVALWVFARYMWFGSPAVAAWPSIAAVRAQMSEFWRFSAPRSLGAVFQILISWVDVLLVGIFASPGAAALYNVASRYVTLGTYPLQGVAYAVTPQFSRLMARNQVAEASALFRVATAWVIMVSWPILFLFMAFGSAWMGIFGPEYKHGAEALALIAGGMLLNCGTGPAGQALGMAGRTMANMTVAAVSLVANLTLNIALIPRYGITGAAIAWLVSLAITSAITSTLLWRATGVSPFSRGSLLAASLSILLFACAGTAVRGIFGAHIPVLVGFAVGAFAVYLAALVRQAPALGLDPVVAAVVKRVKRP